MIIYVITEQYKFRYMIYLHRESIWQFYVQPKSKRHLWHCTRCTYAVFVFHGKTIQ